VASSISKRLGKFSISTLLIHPSGKVITISSSSLTVIILFSAFRILLPSCLACSIKSEIPNLVNKSALENCEALNPSLSILSNIPWYKLSA
jgi:hypothetical protein